MHHPAPGRTTTRRGLSPTVAAVVVAIAAFIGILGHEPAPSSARSLGDGPPPGAPGLMPPIAATPVPSFDAIPRGELGRATAEDDAAITEADGALPDGATAFDDAYPGIKNLDPALLRAVREATRNAADDGIALHVNSGWRSPEYQTRLLRAAIAEYGSQEEAARWVATADTSPHVSGDAVDIGSVDSTTWLSGHGPAFGLCQIYRNEPWHFELRPEAIADGCPRMYADPTRDP